MNDAHLEFLASPAWTAMLEADLFPWLDRIAELGDDLLELGPGPGLTTDLLRRRTAHVTAVEIDDDLASALAGRLTGTNVEVIHGDAADTGLEADRFSAVVCFGMLHHVPSVDAQDRILAEVHRVLRPGASFYGTDSRDLDPIRTFHTGDDFVPLGEDAVAGRLQRAGLTDVEVEVEDYEVRFRATKAPGA